MELPIAPGTTLRGKYRVEHVLAQGGMGVIVSAWHLLLEQRVALKLLKPDLLSNPEVVQRFLREGRAASRLESDHVARVMDVDTLEGGVPFIVLEYLDGGDLSRVRAEGHPLPAGEAVDLVVQACDAVGEAHRVGIVHRDLKPGNLFVVRRRDGSSRLKVLDFGISKLDGHPGSQEPGITGTGVVMGSVEYMSPEQMRSARQADERADIWALGVILYELCTARVPFPGATFHETCDLVLSAPPVPPRSLRPDIPRGLEAVILRCLQKERERRFPTVAELVDALRPFREASGVVEVRAAAPRALGAADEAPTHILPRRRPGGGRGRTTWHPLRKLAVGRGWRAAGVGLVVVLLCLGAGMLLLRELGGASSSAAAPAERR